LLHKARGEVSILPVARQVQHQIEDEDEADDVPIDVLKDCVINMFRQVNLQSIPALSGYLEEYYAEIPACMMIPIIVSAYTAAQKVAFTHDDIKDGQNVERAKQSMARWRHGLSAVAPTKGRSHSSTATSRSSSVSSFRRSQGPNQTVVRSTPLSLSSLTSNVESPIHVLSEYGCIQESLQPEMMGSSSAVPTSSGRNMKPSPPNESLTEGERKGNQPTAHAAHD